MRAYRIYLTKSSEVAALIAKASALGEGIIRISHGFAEDKKEIPQVYYDQGYFYCLIEKESDRQDYEIVFA